MTSNAASLIKAYLRLYRQAVQRGDTALAAEFAADLAEAVAAEQQATPSA